MGMLYGITIMNMIISDVAYFTINNIMGERAEVSIWHFLFVKINSREIIVVS